MLNFLAQAQELFPYTQSLRRDFHMHPELGFREIRTGGIVAKELESLGIEVTKGIGKTGVVGLLEGVKPGPTLLLRFDMDASPSSRRPVRNTRRKIMASCMPAGTTVTHPLG